MPLSLPKWQVKKTNKQNKTSFSPPIIRYLCRGQPGTLFMFVRCPTQGQIKILSLACLLGAIIAVTI